MRIRITILGTSNLNIPIDTGRWRNIPVACCLLKNAYVIYAGQILETNFAIYLFASLQNSRWNLIPEYYTKYPNKQNLSGLLFYCNVNLYQQGSSFIKKKLKKQIQNILWNIIVLFLFILSHLKLDIVNIFYVVDILWNNNLTWCEYCSLIGWST